MKKTVRKRTGTKLYPVKDTDGRFKDISTEKPMPDPVWVTILVCNRTGQPFYASYHKSTMGGYYYLTVAPSHYTDMVRVPAHGSSYVVAYHEET